MIRELTGATRLGDAFPWEGASPPAHRAGPCAVIILGANGDLTSRKLMPALYHLSRHGLLDRRCTIVGVARRPQGDAAFRGAMRAAVAGSDEITGFESRTWRAFARRLAYVGGDLRDPATYACLGERLRALEPRQRNWGRLFYLALPPSVVPAAVRHLQASGLSRRLADPARRPWARIVVEKPLGRDLPSARDLNRLIGVAYAEHQVLRIDHYLGKETVQNLLVLRFANSIFEPVWNRGHVAHVQITAAESGGVGHRAAYYEEAGVVRDMFQSHLLQLLALTAMEPPATLAADAVRDQKVNVLRAVRPLRRSAFRREAVLGQYAEGRIAGRRVARYRREPNVSPNSGTPTYAAVRFQVDNPRWQGVPFYVRSGKRLARRATEIAVQFRRPVHRLFAAKGGLPFAPNTLTIRIQPDEGIALRFEIKVPGVDVRTTSVRMDFAYAEAFGSQAHSAYETLLLDAMVGDTTLFARDDAVEAAWGIVDPLVRAWERRPWARLPNYPAGSWGPQAAAALLRREGFDWLVPSGAAAAVQPGGAGTGAGRAG